MPLERRKCGTEKNGRYTQLLRTAERAISEQILGEGCQDRRRLRKRLVDGQRQKALWNRLYIAVQED